MFKFMPWKKVFAIALLVLVVLIAAVFVILVNLDVNRYKPQIAKLVLDATGRKLTMDGDIDIALGLRPTLVVEDAGFENAPWSSQPESARVKRMEVQLALMPLIWGELDFARLILVEPEVIVEFNSAGRSNFSFGPPNETKAKSPLPVPPLMFSDALVTNGLFTYRDARSGFSFSIRIDRLLADIPGFDKPLQLDFEGAFDDKPFALEGTLGPIWAWVEPGFTLPADLTLKSGGATATIVGELHDPTRLKGLAFDIAAEGSSVGEILRLAGLTDRPDLGPFNLAARVSDAQGHLEFEKLNIQIGTDELVAITLAGDVKNVTALQGVSLNISAQGRDYAALTQLGLPALPERGAFEAAAQISDPLSKVFTTSDLRVVLGDNEFSGQVEANLSDKIPTLTTKLTSKKFQLGQLNLDLEIMGPFEKPAVKKIDLTAGSTDLAEIRLNGSVDDIIGLQGVAVNFQAQGKDLANLKQLTGKPLPIRGAFSAAGRVSIPVHKKLKIPDLKIAVGKNKITGSLSLNLREEQPQLSAVLELPQPDLPSVLLPELAKAGWAKGLSQVRPVKLDVTLNGFSDDIALEKVELLAGSLATAELRLTGKVQNLLTRRGVDLDFSLKGSDVDKLKEIIAQPYLFSPVPGQGAYAVSGKISDPSPMRFRIEDFNWEQAGTQVNGWADLNLAADPAEYEVAVEGPKFNLKLFPLPEGPDYARLHEIDDLGALKIHSKVVVAEEGLSLQHLDLQAGSEQLAAIAVKGSIKRLKTQRGIDLDIDVRGNEVAKLIEATGRSLPLRGAYGLSARLTDPAQKQFKFNDLKLRLGSNNLTGWLDLNLSDDQLRLATDLAAPNFTLQPFTLPALEALARIEDLGALKLALELAGAGQKLTLDNLKFRLGRDDLIDVSLEGAVSDLSAMAGIKLAFTAKSEDMSNFKKIGGPAIPFQGAFSISGELIDPAPKVYKIPAFTAVWAESEEHGWLELDMTGPRPHVKAELSSDRLDLRPLFPSGKEKSDEKTQPSTSKTPKTRVFSAQPLQVDALKAFDADLTYRDKQILLPNLAFEDVIVKVRLKEGNLDVKPVNFKIGGGTAGAQFALHTQTSPARMAANLDIEQLEIGPMLDQLESRRSFEGNLDAALNLEGSGDSVAAIMANLDGHLHIATIDGRADSRDLDLLERYLGSGVLRMLNPFQEKREYTPVNCYVTVIEVQEGLAGIKILLDTDRTSILGAGDINLETEVLDLGIKPSPKKGALPADVSFSFRELSQPFRLGGTLAQPSLTIDPGRAALTLGKFAGALALGPAGLAAFFGDISLGKKDPCAVALQGIKKAEQAAEGEKTKGTSKKTAAGTEEKKKEKSGGFFRRLFGK